MTPKGVHLLLSQTPSPAVYPALRITHMLTKRALQGWLGGPVRQGDRQLPKGSLFLLKMIALRRIALRTACLTAHG